MTNYNDDNDDDIVKECWMDNIIEEENKDIGFDLSLLKRNELHVNLIHFDKNMTNPENYGYYNNFKVDVVGGFLAMDNLDIFKKYLEVIKNKNIPFIVISSGSSGKDVIPICKQYSFVKEVIIFCGNYKYNEHYLKEYPNYVKKVFTSIQDVYNYIKLFGKEKYKQGIQNFIELDKFIFSPEDIKMNKQLEQCPVISAYEYDKCYFLIHRAYAHFFEDMNDKSKDVTFSEAKFKIIKEYINNSKIISGSDKSDLINKFEKLKNCENFVELSIRFYTGESGFCYIFNRSMRNFEPGLISLAYYMGPFLFGVNKYVKENPKNLSFKNNMTLYRLISCSIYDFYLYQINLGHIICFPSITSTSSVRGQFKPTSKSKSINNNGIKEEDMLNITMIFNYKHEANNISPGIIVKDNKGKDGEFLSSNPYENEVILFPFTFVRIKSINPEGKNTYEMNLDIINRKDYIEYTLRDNVEKRTFFSSLD